MLPPPLSAIPATGRLPRLDADEPKRRRCEMRGCNNHRITPICLKAPIFGLLCYRGAIGPNWSHMLGHLVVLEASRLVIVNFIEQAPWPHIKHGRVDFWRILVRGKLPSRTLESVRYAG